MRDIVLKVYDDNDEVIKEVTATKATIRFGVVRQLMKLLKVDEIEDTGELFGVILGAWDEVIKLLDKFFPDMEEEDWNGVDVEELVPTVFLLLKDIFAETLTIPKDPKN